MNKTLAVAAVLLPVVQLPLGAAQIPVPPAIQRSFPVDRIVVKSINTVDDTLKVKSTEGLYAGEFAFVVSTGGSTSIPSINRLYTGLDPLGFSHGSADSLATLYFLTPFQDNRVRLYSSRDDAKFDRNWIDFTSEGSNAFELYTSTSNWCWNACTQMLLNASGTFRSQDQIADEAFIALDDGRHLNIPNHLTEKTDFYKIGKFPYYTFRNGAGKLLRDLGGILSKVHGQLTDEQLQTEIDGARPMMIVVRGADVGHVFVGYGMTGTALNIRDPWPTIGTVVTNSGLLRSSGYEFGGGAPWVETLATAKSLDLVFLIDTTGSMDDDIQNVKVNASTILNNVADKFKDYRIAVIEYKDYPQEPYGDPSDFTFKVRTTFTKNATTAFAAINALSASGGNDVPESVYSAAYAALDGNVIGGWRPNPTIREIIVMGDAEGHDPEPFPNGRSSREVIEKAQDPDLLIRISGVIPGTSPEALAMGDLLAGSTGGISIGAANADEVSDAINSAIAELADNARFPRGNVAAIYPLFALDDKDTGGMEQPPKSYTLMLQRFDQRRDRFVHFKTFKIERNGSTFVPRAPLPLGTFRWKLAMRRGPKSGITGPDGTPIFTPPQQTSAEDDWTEFNRLEALPSAPIQVEPSPDGFVADTKRVTYVWNAGLNATRYAVEIFRDGRRWKRLFVSPPRNDPNASTLMITLNDHSIGQSYSWRIQALNFDRRKIDSAAWVP